MVNFHGSTPRCSLSAARWLTAKNPNPHAASEATIEGFYLADDWKRMNNGAPKDKLNAIYLRSQP
jgi:hypothetical protein